MRLDHIAYRVLEKNSARKFFEDQLGYYLLNEFEPMPGVSCFALGPAAQKRYMNNRTLHPPFSLGFHDLPCEIFISEGEPGTVVREWVENTGGGVHHMAYNVEDVQETIDAWVGVDFLTPKAIEDKGITQAFTKPITEIGGVIIELISRKPGVNFSSKNVKKLMQSTDGH